MPRFTLVVLAALWALPASAQLAGVRGGPVLSFFDAEGVSSTSLDPTFSLFLEIELDERVQFGLDLSYLTGTREVDRIPVFPPRPGSVKTQYGTLTPSLLYSPAGGAIRPRVFAGPVVAFRLREDALAEGSDASVQTYDSRGITYGATGGVGLAAGIGQGALREVRLDLEGTYLSVNPGVSMATVGLRLGVAIKPPSRIR